MGCPVSFYLAAAGVSRLGLVDYDTVEISNLHRQIGHKEVSKGTPKVVSLALALKDLNSNIKVEEHNLLLSNDNAVGIVSGYDLIIDATDNAVTRYLLNDACVLAGRRPLISGAALRLDGQLTTYNYGMECPCYRCIYPDPPPASMITNCDVGGVLGPVPGMIGTLQAIEALKILAMEKANYAGKMLIFSGESGEFKTVKLRKRSAMCSVCGDSPSITKLVDYSLFCGSKPNDKSAMGISLLSSEERINVKELALMFADQQRKKPFILLDVRSHIQSEIFTLPQTTLSIPLSELEGRLGEVYNVINSQGRSGEPIETEIICICRRGNDSQRAVCLLKKHGFKMIKDVVGGIHEYARTIDPDQIPIY